MTYIKKGFTLLEIVIVIALIGLFIVAISYNNQDIRIDQKNTERLANRIYDIIRDTRNNMIIWRWVLSGSSLVVASQRDITISSTGLVVWYQYGNSNSGIELSFLNPFFDSDSRYQIIDISVSSGWTFPDNMYSWDLTWATSANINLNLNSETIITAIKWWVSVPWLIRSVKITSWFWSSEKSVIMDRIKGTVEIRNSSED